MSLRSIAGIVTVCFALCAITSDVSGLDIVRNGKPAATIVVPKFEDYPLKWTRKPTEWLRDNDPLMKKWTVKPAEWLRDYIKRSTGAELKIVEEGQPVEGNIISVGHTKLSKAAGITLDGLKWDGGKMVVKGNTLYLVGRDEIGPMVHRLGVEPLARDFLGAKGTCKMTTTFLADYLGVKWYIPSPMGELVPKKTDIAVPDDLDKTVQPKMAFFHGPYFYGIGTPSSFANNMRSAVRIYTCSGHTWQTFVSAEEYFKDHPEYFALKGGKRSAGERYTINTYACSLFGKLVMPQLFDPGKHRNHLCTTNPNVKRILLRETRKRFDMGYDWVQLGQSDGYQRCQCPKCEALDSYRGWTPPKKYKNRNEYLRENRCERIHLLHKAIIDECAKSHPDKTIHLLAYAPTAFPSKKFDRYGDNVVAEVCGGQYSEWHDKVRAMTTYLYTWCLTRPVGLGSKCTAKQVAGIMRSQHKNGVIGLYCCGGGDSWGLDGPTYYLAGQMVDNPDLDWRDCLEDYCGFVYGEAGQTMTSFFTRLYAVSDKKEGIRDIEKLYVEAGFPELVPPAGRYKHFPYRFYLTYYPPEVIQGLEQLLSKAETEAQSERAKGWVRLTRDYFDLTKGYAEAYECYRICKAQENPSNFRQLEEAVNRWKAVRDRLLAYGKDKQYVATWFPNWVNVEKFFEAGGVHLRFANR